MTQINDLIEKEKNYIRSFSDLVYISNNLGCTDGKIIGTGRSDYTQSSTSYDLSINGKTFSLIDIPGIEGNEKRFEEIIRSSLDKAHTIFYVNGSGKKIEKNTLQKIKNYMHDGTSVYAVFNVHCKPKMKRKKGIDKLYPDELSEAYEQYSQIAEQTEKELRSFLNDNYKGRILVNGLLAFCGLAFDSHNLTTIVYDTDKTLRSDQKKYLNEYNGDRTAMLKDSRISRIEQIINDKTSGFEKNIYDENIKKLKNRLSETIEKVSTLKNTEVKKIDGFINVYDDFEQNCRKAKEEYIQSVDQIGYNAASDAFSDVKNELYDMIEQSGGKINQEQMEQYLDDNKQDIIKNIQTSINNRMKQLQKDYEENINDAVQRLVKDFDREQIKFNVSLSNVDISINGLKVKQLTQNLKSFAFDALSIVGFATDGFFIGMEFGNIVGAIIGAIIGAISGIVLFLLNFFTSQEKRINQAKEQIQQVLDEQIGLVDDEIQKQLEEMEYEKKINESYDKICDQIQVQKDSLNNIKLILTNVESELKKNYHKVLS